MVYLTLISTPILLTSYKITMEKLKPYILAYKGISFLKKIKQYTKIGNINTNGIASTKARVN